MSYIASFIAILAQLITALVVFRAILSWLPISHDGPLATFLYAVTEPILSPVRDLLPSVGGMDLSPLVVILALQLVETMFSMLS